MPTLGAMKMSVIRKYFKSPASNSAWAIILGFTLYVLMDLIYINFFNFDPFTAHPRFATIEWFARLVRDTALTIAVATMIISGIRNIRKNGYTLKRLLFPAMGIFMSLLFLCMSILGYQTFKRLDFHRTSDVIRNQIESSLKSPDISDGKKSFLSKYRASMLFYEDGVRSSYITESGKVELYIPTDKEMKQREDKLKWESLNKRINRSLYLSIYFWLVIISMSLFLGVLLPIRKDNKIPPNKCIQTDAAVPRR